MCRSGANGRRLIRTIRDMKRKNGVSRPMLTWCKRTHRRRTTIQYITIIYARILGNECHNNQELFFSSITATSSASAHPLPIHCRCHWRSDWRIAVNILGTPQKSFFRSFLLMPFCECHLMSRHFNRHRGKSIRNGKSSSHGGSGQVQCYSKTTFTGFPSPTSRLPPGDMTWNSFLCASTFNIDVPLCAAAPRICSKSMQLFHGLDSIIHSHKQRMRCFSKRH